MKPLRVEFELTKDDLRAQLRTCAEKDPGVRAAMRRVKRLLGVIFLLAAASQAAMCLLVPHVDVVSVAVVVFTGLWLLWCWPTRRWVHRLADRQVKAQFATPAGRAYLGPREIEVGPDGMVVTSDYGRTVFHWRAVLDVAPTRDYLFLVVPGPGYMAIPRRAFEFDDDFRHFAHLVAELAERGGGLAAEYPLGPQFKT
jgi:hypothetical protein